MTATLEPIVPIPSFDELSPAFQERARRGPGATRGSLCFGVQI